MWTGGLSPGTPVSSNTNANPDVNESDLYKLQYRVSFFKTFTWEIYTKW